jgi:riboflavin kinase / FMN adenylyltransferase
VQVVHGLGSPDDSMGPVFVVVGVFDGLHLGHAYLLRHLVTEAGRRGARPVVITFDHHPDEIITGSAPPLLCDPGERLDRLEAAGVDTTVVVHFDQHLRQTTYDAFVEAIAARTPLAGFLMTPDAAFGYQRAGTPDVVVPPLELDGRAVRSSEVRADIVDGNLDGAARLLGRPHAVVGEASPVESGSELAFAVPVALPPPGTYVVELGGSGVTGSGVAGIADGRVTLAGERAAGPVRVAFLRREGPVR